MTLKRQFMDNAVRLAQHSTVFTIRLVTMTLEITSAVFCTSCCDDGII